MIPPPLKKSCPMPPTMEHPMGPVSNLFFAFLGIFSPVPIAPLTFSFNLNHHVEQLRAPPQSAEILGPSQLNDIMQQIDPTSTLEDAVASALVDFVDDFVDKVVV
ncbi:unnamed protein product [Gongylonema pulchrum]|uniref:Transcription initiation factor TFIID subunit 12 n=1 Tax=Gongylonema pulchrum TaxID=637853 RepID=A0A183E6P4_9BILA|nr:unnamed protein product [Gongylonema pulchrum]